MLHVKLAYQYRYYRILCFCYKNINLKANIKVIIMEMYLFRFGVPGSHPAWCERRSSIVPPSRPGTARRAACPAYHLTSASNLASHPGTATYLLRYQYGSYGVQEHSYRCRLRSSKLPYLVPTELYYTVPTGTGTVLAIIP